MNPPHSSSSSAHYAYHHHFDMVQVVPSCPHAHTTPFEAGSKHSSFASHLQQHAPQQPPQQHHQQSPVAPNTLVPPIAHKTATAPTHSRSLSNSSTRDFSRLGPMSSISKATPHRTTSRSLPTVLSNSVSRSTDSATAPTAYLNHSRHLSSTSTTTLPSSDDAQCLRTSPPPPPKKARTFRTIQPRLFQPQARKSLMPLLDSLEVTTAEQSRGSSSL
jgi:hypothetical protein